MRFESIAAAVLLLGAACPSPWPPTAVPERFRGAWNEEPAHCGTGIGHGGLVIERDRVRYYESGGRVRAVVVEGARELAIIAAMSGEGMDWLGFLHFRLSPDGQRLLERTADGTSVVHHRCPADAPASDPPQRR